MSVTAAFEGRLNVLLSEVLNESGLISRAELIGSGRRDVVVFMQYKKGTGYGVLEGSRDNCDEIRFIGPLQGNFLFDETLVREPLRDKECYK